MLTFPGWTVIGLLRLCLSRYAGHGEYGHGRGVRGILGFKADALLVILRSACGFGKPGAQLGAAKSARALALSQGPIA